MFILSIIKLINLFIIIYIFIKIYFINKINKLFLCFNIKLFFYWPIKRVTEKYCFFTIPFFQLLILYNIGDKFVILY